MLETEKCYCPYCGERIQVLVDLSAGEEQSYIEDCSVCCRPIVFSVFVDIENNDFSLVANAENDV